MKNKKTVAAVGLTCVLASGLLLGNIDYATHTYAAAKLAVKETAAVAGTVKKNAAQKRQHRVWKKRNLSM